MESNKTNAFEKFDSLNELNDCFKNEPVFGRKLVYIGCSGDWFMSYPEGKCFSYNDIVSFSWPNDDVVSVDELLKRPMEIEKNEEMVSTRFYRMCGSPSYTGDTSYLCFDDGSCLSIGLFDDYINERYVAELESIKDYKSIPKIRFYFKSNHLFDNVIGSRLVDAEMIPGIEDDVYPAQDKKVFYRSGSFYGFEGQVKLSFDNDITLAFLFDGCHSSVWSYKNDILDTCSFDDIEECCELKGKEAVLRYY